MRLAQESVERCGYKQLWSVTATRLEVPLLNLIKQQQKSTQIQDEDKKTRTRYYQCRAVPVAITLIGGQSGG